jgi:hypothetical protein
VVDSGDENDTIWRLADLRRTQPVDATLRNLLGILTTKLDLCSLLPVLVWEAESEGHLKYADTLRDLAAAEQRSCSMVLDCLRDRLADVAVAERGHG